MCFRINFLLFFHVSDYSLFFSDPEPLFFLFYQVVNLYLDQIGTLTLILPPRIRLQKPAAVPLCCST